MSAYLAPEIVAALLLLTCILIFFAAPEAFRFFKGRLRDRRNMSVLEIPADKLKKSLYETLKNLEAPFIFEMAIHHLGKDIRYYLIVPKSAVEEAVNVTKAIAAHDYNVYHSKGKHAGFYFRSGDVWPDINPALFDLPRVNEIGEGFSLQLIIKEIDKKGATVNFRFLASAPTPYQAQEIISEAKALFSGLKLAEAKNAESFIENFNSRKFEAKEAMRWLNPRT